MLQTNLVETSKWSGSSEWVDGQALERISSIGMPKMKRMHQSDMENQEAALLKLDILNEEIYVETTCLMA